jgi:uncharacterized protein YjbI with pentapeptide repeats
MKHQIKNRYTGDVLFECELPAHTPSGLAMRHTLEKAIQNKANLRGADLRGANLRGADLQWADLRWANLRGADLRWANLRGADLQGADLRWANLQEANLQDGNLIGDRPFFQIGPIGSRYDYLTAWITDQGLKLQAGCFFGTVEEFTEKLSTTHADNDHAKEYQMALMMIEAHACIWTPKEQSK